MMVCMYPESGECLLNLHQPGLDKIIPLNQFSPTGSNLPPFHVGGSIEILKITLRVPLKIHKGFF